MKNKCLIGAHIITFASQISQMNKCGPVFKRDKLAVRKQCEARGHVARQQQAQIRTFLKISLKMLQSLDLFIN